MAKTISVRIFGADAFPGATEWETDVFEHARRKFGSLANIVVGSDGLRIEGDGRTAFIAYEEIVVSARKTELTVTSRRRGELAFTLKDEAAATRVASDIRAAIEANRQIAGRNPRAVVVKGATATERLASLREIGAASAQSYRTAAYTRADLWNIVVSPVAADRDRFGAIVALRVGASKEDGERLVAFVDGLANTIAAARFCVAVSGDDAALAELFTDGPSGDEALVASTLAGRLLRRRK